MIWLQHFKIWELILSRKYEISKHLLNSLDLLSWSTLIITHLASASDVFTTRNFCPPLPPPSLDISLDLFPTIYIIISVWSSSTWAPHTRRLPRSANWSHGHGDWCQAEGAAKCWHNCGDHCQHYCYNYVLLLREGVIYDH